MFFRKPTATRIWKPLFLELDPYILRDATFSTREGRTRGHFAFAAAIENFLQIYVPEIFGPSIEPEFYVQLREASADYFKKQPGQMCLKHLSDSPPEVAETCAYFRNGYRSNSSNGVIYSTPAPVGMLYQLLQPYRARLFQRHHADILNQGGSTIKCAERAARTCALEWIGTEHAAGISTQISIACSVAESVCDAVLK